MSFHEKSAWVCLASLCAVYAPYFYVTLNNPASTAGLFIFSVIGLVVILSISFAVTAIWDRNVRAKGTAPSLDELDSKIELQAAKWTGTGLGIFVLGWVLYAMFALFSVLRVTSQMDTLPSPSLHIESAILAVNVLFAGFVLANLAYYLIIALGYRSMARE